VALLHYGDPSAASRRAQLARAERAFDRLNPGFGVPADTTSPSATVTSTSGSVPWPSGSGWPSTTAARTTPVRSWQPGQDYRMADAIHAARH
jgi:hypothetical protein